MPKRLTIALFAASTCAALLLAACSDDPPPDPADIPFLTELPAAPYTNAQICSLLDSNGNASRIVGQDGGTSSVSGGRIYWTFGDTVVPGSGTSNNVAVSDDFDASDCITLEHKRDITGVASDLLPPQDDEITVWPAAGHLSLRPGEVYFLFNSVLNADNQTGTFNIDEIGLGKFDTATLTGQRIIEPLIAREDLRDEDIRLTSAVDMLEHEGYVYIYFAVGWNARVGRVPSAQIEDKAAYRYWTGAEWSPDPAAARDILQTAAGQNAFNVDFNPSIGKWTAIYSSDTLSSVAIAYADAPEGPFTGETVLLDCVGLTFRFNSVNPPAGFPTLMRPLNPQFKDSYRCYHATQHPELDTNDRQTMYMTYGNLSMYRLFLHRFTLGVPFAQWDDERGRSSYARDGAGGDATAAGARRGVAFYAPVAAEEGLTPIHHWVDAASGANRYEAAMPGPSFTDQGIAFYARVEETAGLAPVYRWQHDSEQARFVYSTSDLQEQGYSQQGIAFYAADLAGQRFFDPGGGYVYWVRTKDGNDFGCCGANNNPTRQTSETSVEYTLATEPAEQGYEAIVCSPICGTAGEVVWSGNVEFEPNEIGGKLKLTPEGPD